MNKPIISIHKQKHYVYKWISTFSQINKSVHFLDEKHHSFAHSHGVTFVQVMPIFWSVSKILNKQMSDIHYWQPFSIDSRSAVRGNLGE